MRYFANPSTPKVRDAMATGLLDVIETPAQGNRPVEGAVWCADNGCFGKGFPGDEAWYAWLSARAYRAASCLFAVAPDVVGDASATWRRSQPWLPKIRELGFPAALVAQDGLERMEIEWDAFDVLFIGGSTEWKLGPHAHRIALEAKKRGKHVHMGRVNSLRRLRHAQLIGCDSVDGTFIAFAPDQNLPRMLSNLEKIRALPPLDGLFS